MKTPAAASRHRRWIPWQTRRSRGRRFSLSRTLGTRLFFDPQTGGDVAPSFLGLLPTVDDVSFWVEALPAADPHSAALLMAGRDT